MKNDIQVFRHLYAEAVLQVFRDLNRPVVNVEYIDKHTGIKQLKPWYVYFGEKLKTFQEYVTRHNADPWLSIPEFSRAVDLWACNALTEYNIKFGLRANVQQRAINNVLQSKLDTVFIEGDPYLTARTLMQSTRQVRFMMHLGGLSSSKSDDAVAKLLGIAENLNRDLCGFMADVYQPHKNLLLQLDLSGLGESPN